MSGCVLKSIITSVFKQEKPKICQHNLLKVVLTPKQIKNGSKTKYSMEIQKINKIELNVVKENICYSSHC